MDEQRYAMSCGPNDGGIKRGDRADTGDNQVRHKDGVGEGGSGVPGGSGGSTGAVTGVTDSLAESRGGVSVSSDDVLEHTGGIDDLGLTDVEDRAIGLTDTSYRPPEDWAADTGSTKTQEDEQAEIEAAPIEPAPEPKRYRREKKKAS